MRSVTRPKSRWPTRTRRPCGMPAVSTHPAGGPARTPRSPAPAEIPPAPTRRPFRRTEKGTRHRPLVKAHPLGLSRSLVLWYCPYRRHRTHAGTSGAAGEHGWEQHRPRRRADTILPVGSRLHRRQLLAGPACPAAPAWPCGDSGRIPDTCARAGLSPEQQSATRPPTRPLGCSTHNTRGAEATQRAGLTAQERRTCTRCA